MDLVQLVQGLIVVTVLVFGGIRAFGNLIRTVFLEIKAAIQTRTSSVLTTLLVIGITAVAAYLLLSSSGHLLLPSKDSQYVILPAITRVATWLQGVLERIVSK